MTVRFLFIVFVIFLIGCGPSTPEEQTLSLPTAIGNPHQILLVADKDFLESDLADSIDVHISSIFMIVPKYENLIDIDVVDPKDFQSYFKQRRHIIFIDALDKQTATAKAIKKVLGPEKIRKAIEDKTFRMATEKDKWAKGQQVIYLFAPTTDELPEVIHKFSKNVHKKIYDFDVPLVRANAFAGGLNEGTIGKIETKLNVRVDIPQGYRVISDKVIDDNTMWLANTTTKISYNIIIRTMDYNENSKLTEENIIKVRNDIGKAYISTQVKGAYMTTEVQNRPFPVFARTNIDNHYALEARGLYKMVGDYMGGSFVSYMVYNSTTNRVVFMDGFIQAPEKEEHREYLLRLEAIMKTLKF